MNNKNTIPRTCIECQRDFLADPREVNRGNALFCSLSCAAFHNNRVRLLSYKTLSKNCPQCGKTFKTKLPEKIYCSMHCRQQFYYKRNSHKGYPQELKNLPCEVCGWHESTIDHHHIISPRKEGPKTLDNLVVVCPNCHRKIHKNLISQDDLYKIVNSRTISSSA